MFPEVRAIVELPNEDAVTQDTFLPVVKILPDLIARWHIEVKTALAKKLRESYKAVLLRELDLDGKDALAYISGFTDSDLLNLAIIFFRCPGCSEQLYYPSLTAHLCRVPWHQSKIPVPQQSDLYMRIVCSLLKHPPWSVNHVNFETSPETIAPLRTMTGLCGLDWKTATCEDLDRCKAWFVCTCWRCVKAKPKTVMNWQYVVSFLEYAYVYRDEVVDMCACRRVQLSTKYQRNMIVSG